LLLTSLQILPHNEQPPLVKSYYYPPVSGLADSKSTYAGRSKKGPSLGGAEEEGEERNEKKLYLNR